MRFSLAVVVSASGAGFAGAPGAPCGQSSNIVWPGAGGHWANRVVGIPRTAASRINKWRTKETSRLKFTAGMVARLGIHPAGFAALWSDLEGTVALFQIPDGGHERVDLFACVVQSKRRPNGAFHAEAAKNRLSA